VYASNIESKEIVDQYMCVEKKQPQQFKKLGLFSFTFCFLEPLVCELFLCCGQLCVFALICFSDSLFLPTTPTPPTPPTPPNTTNTTTRLQYIHTPLCVRCVFGSVMAMVLVMVLDWFGLGYGSGSGSGYDTGTGSVLIAGLLW